MEEKNITKELTLEAIAGLIKTSAAETVKLLEERMEEKITSSTNEVVRILEEKIESSIGDMAIMSQNNFLKLEEKIEEIENNIKEIKASTEDIKADLNKKVDKIEYNTLTYRVEKLEEKIA